MADTESQRRKTRAIAALREELVGYGCDIADIPHPSRDLIRVSSTSVGGTGGATIGSDVHLKLTALGYSQLSSHSVAERDGNVTVMTFFERSTGTADQVPGISLRSDTAVEMLEGLRKRVEAAGYKMEVEGSGDAPAVRLVGMGSTAAETLIEMFGRHRYRPSAVEKYPREGRPGQVVYSIRLEQGPQGR